MTADPLVRSAGVRIPEGVLDEVAAGYGRRFECVSKRPARELAAAALDPEAAREQVASLCGALGSDAATLRGKRVLEVGSSFGIFVAVTRSAYGMESFGLATPAAGFEDAQRLGQSILGANGLDPAILIEARGEAIPFPDDHFDFVVSRGALDRSEDPERVLDESLRVLAPGGALHFEFPDYGSFFVGHYAVPWIPYLPHWLGRLWVQLCGRDPGILDTLQFTSRLRTRRWLASRADVEIVSFERARATDPLRAPIVLTLRKRSSPVSSLRDDNQQIYDDNWPQWLDMKRFGPSSRWLRALIGDLLGGPLRGAEIKRVLDFGCGEGTTTEFLAHALPRASVRGVDQSSSGIDCAKTHYHAPNLEFRHQPAEAMLREADFDLVTCFEVLEHVEDWQALAERLAAATSRYLLVSFPTGRMRDFEVNVGHLRNFRPGQFESFLERRGFRSVETFYAGFPFYSPLFRDVCNLTNSGGNTLTRGHYSFWTQRLGDLIFFTFRYLSTRSRGGDQFCGLFERVEPAGNR